MKLTPREVEKLMLHDSTMLDSGYLAQKRLARGLRLNYIEVVALLVLTTQNLEFVRDGEKTVAELDLGKQLLGRYGPYGPYGLYCA
ncbi:hypothetical protein RHMOL_Rhmol02G0170900 [Rhododendron molle]|uniref:Uncharacterized protein n=1 Tax=Rhododendron molle TaxID=49168 RepID=A0ACC0PQX8_RHOML|nr:hypothetical protein RHMOL_Rhmol02G0170900 [Rhododendron molle]